MSVKLLKMSNGDDVICGFTEDVDQYVMKSPVRLVITPNGPGMIPYLLFAKEQTVRVDKSKVWFVNTPEDEITNAYNEKFGNGIVFASGADVKNLSL